MRRHQATETLTLEQADERFISTRAWTLDVLSRLDSLLPARKLKILELGAAQGRTLIALAELGHLSCGVEPYVPAITVAQQLAKQHGVNIDLREGVAESLPFESDTFDLVLAFSVMEHVADVDAALAEVSRVLRRQGVFWFSSASALCPIQSEIAGFPFFSWYPDRLKRKVMIWAQENRPELIGGTEHPALTWWTPWKARTKLQEAGLVDLRSRWQLGKPSESSRLLTAAVSLIGRMPALSIVADIFVPGCSYAARKP